MSSLQRDSADGVVGMIDHLLERAILRQASDVHFEPTDDAMRVRYRLDGVLHDIDTLPKTLADNIIARLKVLAGLLTYRVDIPQEGAFVHRTSAGAGGRAADIRVAVFPTVRGERAVVRLLQPQHTADSIEKLGLSAEVIGDLVQAAQSPQGLILVTGPAGSGKSTTLYALARQVLADTPGRSVVSLEDPVEQRVNGMAQIQIAPHGELDYVRAMRSLLRQDVQVLLVGEIRDAETARVVLEASLTGHLIMSTLHSGDPAETIVRLLEMGLDAYQLVAGLTLICSQRLLRVVCEACGGKGCDGCAMTGYRGRTACGQTALMDEMLRQEILRRAPVDTLRRIIAQKRSALSMDVQRLIDAGRSTRQEALRVLGSLT